jgi:hypothetical protein
MRLKGFSTPTFHSSFDRLQRAGETAAGQRAWTAHGLAWTRERHAFYGVDHSFTTEVVRVSASGAKGWSLMVVREGWWAGDGTDPIKTRQWSHFVKGDRQRALAEFGRLFDSLQLQGRWAGTSGDVED